MVPRNRQYVRSYDRREMPVALDGGPIIVHKDMAAHYTKDLVSSLR